MSFSERYGYQIPKEIQIEEINDRLRTRIINVFVDLLCEAQAEYILDHLGKEIYQDFDSTFDNLFSPSKNKKNLMEFLKGKNTEWFQIYDAVEYGVEYYLEEENYNSAENYTDTFNKVLEQEKSAYRFIDFVLCPITNEAEIMEISNAMNTSYDSVNTHLFKALNFYSDREVPDYENTIKESISAVEALCSIITGEDGRQSTLGKTISKLKDKQITLHPAFEDAVKKLYGFASDQNGLRHGGKTFSFIPEEDARFCLIICSSIINYLIVKFEVTGES